MNLIRESVFLINLAHLFTPAASRTIKTLSASLLGKWIIYDDKWITDSEKAGRWLPEAKYGIKSTGSPFKGKKFFLTESFHKENKGTARKDVYMNYINCLLVSIGKGELVDEAGSADYVLKGFLSGEKKPGELDWKGFISMIPQPPLI